VIARRAKVQFASSSIYQDLSSGFLKKLESTLSVADRQIKARRAKGLIYLLMYFDDFTLDYYDRYRKQISACLEAHTAERIYVKIALMGRKHIRKTPSRNSRMAPNSSIERDAPKTARLS
jgi:hypothetical protein